MPINGISFKKTYRIYYKLITFICIFNINKYIVLLIKIF